MDSPCVSSDNESEHSFNLDDVTCIPDDDDREPLPMEEAAARYNVHIEREEESKKERISILFQSIYKTIVLWLFSRYV